MRPDVQVAIRVVGSNRRTEYEESEADRPNFGGAGLNLADLSDLDLTHYEFSGTSLHLANFTGTRICNAKLMRQDGSYPARSLTKT